ncbi:MULTISPECIES: hypothetical protein [Luteimonas]|uniref:hypothetical protein n=1 Tax=Luteimonas TaxID=83614 RepID=UPI00117D4958|nr:MULTISPECIES: hypothetical protein [Luteimonas]
MSAAPLDHLLSKLEGVQSSGRGYRACCPACGGRSRKLSITQAEEGRLLVHCFGGCVTSDVLGSIGLGIADLFPERLPADSPAARHQARTAARESQWGAALEALEHEALVIHIAGQQLAKWHLLSAEDDERLSLAVRRVEEARMILRPFRQNWRPRAVAS